MIKFVIDYKYFVKFAILKNSPSQIGLKCLSTYLELEGCNKITKIKIKWVLKNVKKKGTEMITSVRWMKVFCEGDEEDDRTWREYLYYLLFAPFFLRSLFVLLTL